MFDCKNRNPPIATGVHGRAVTSFKSWQRRPDFILDLDAELMRQKHKHAHPILRRGSNWIRMDHADVRFS